MNPFQQFPEIFRQQISFVLTDIDDTLTLDGRLPAVAYSAIEQLHSAGIRVIPITGRPAGWCDHIARMWPVDGVVGENGAFYFSYNQAEKKMVRRFWRSAEQRQQDRARLRELQDKILQDVPGCALSTDQPYREADLAIDFCEDVAPLPMVEVRNIVRIFEEAGANAKISSIHVNGWFGDFDKLAMTREMFRELFDSDLGIEKSRVIFAGDSPNDESMFGFFPHSVGMANVLDFVDHLSHQPAWITEKRGGFGFAEMTSLLLSR